MNSVNQEHYFSQKHIKRTTLITNGYGAFGILMQIQKGKRVFAITLTIFLNNKKKYEGNLVAPLV